MKQTVRLNDLQAFCQQRIAGWSERQLILLSGPLGSGKTQFVKSCVQILGGDVPDSPTFSLINEYHGARCPVWHVDLYRLTGEADVDSTGFWDLFSAPKGLIFVEWPENVETSSWPLSWDKMELRLAFGVQADERIFQWN